MSKISNVLAIIGAWALSAFVFMASCYGILYFLDKFLRIVGAYQ